MARSEKLIRRLKKIPKDFTWDELTKVLNHFGYFEVPTNKTGGSRRKFSNDKKEVIALHKPHPQNNVKPYVIRLVLKKLNL